ncbi:hypothetical protein [Modestobacter sp. NPDC049651]|uniref:hypothetical protein n=1 Tax=unclassified Modestobacter TaxID=2643866 RepID=UPI0033ED87CB
MDDDALAELADALGVDPRTALRALGGGWRRADVRGREWPVDRWTGATWFVAGKPRQVLLGVDHAQLVLARPLVRWDPGPVLGWTDAREFARDDVTFQPDLLADAVEDVVRASRRRLRWCRTCRTVHAPEDMHDRDDCSACAASHRGIRP